MSPTGLPFAPEDLAAVAGEAAAWAWSEGMTVLRPDGSVVPIPLLAEPEVWPRAALVRLAAEARAILSGSVKLARALLHHGDARDREMLLGPFEGLEAEAMARLFVEAPEPVLLARVDFLLPAGASEPRALELNTTIPAMQAYADLAAHGWLRAAARRRGLTVRQTGSLLAEAGSHMEELRRTLVAFYQRRGGARERPSIALVARPGDAQRAEQQRPAVHFRQMGHEAVNLTPAECEPERFDLLYRHVWAHNVPPEAPFARALRAPGRFLLVNPVNGMLEAKALFARLSECAEDPRLAELAGLDPAEREASARLPWTRRLEPELLPRLLEDRAPWVLKRSWDYGGKSVHLGAEMAPADWEAAVLAALADRRGGGFVVQERIFAARRPATRITTDGPSAGELFRDISTYAGLGEIAPTGSVVRAASSPVVNILGGGGLAPLISEETLAHLR
jgi:hypothetical protein